MAYLISDHVTAEEEVREPGVINEPGMGDAGLDCQKSRMNEKDATQAVRNEPALFCGSCNDFSDGRGPSLLPKLSKKKRKPKMVFSAPEADLEESLSQNVLSIEDETCDLNVSNLMNSSQSLLLNSVLEQMQSVMDVKTDLEAKTVRITYNPIAISVQTIIKSLDEVGLHAKEISSPIKQRHELSQSSVRTLCRSSLYVQGICCSTEVPIIKGIIRKVFKSGIKKISINIPSRMVYIEHDYSSVTAKDIENVLNNEGFGASIKTNGKRGNISLDTEDFTTCPASNFVESTLIVHDLESRDDIDEIAYSFEACEFLPHKIRNYSCNLASRTIKVEHNPQVLEASTIAQSLMGSDGFKNVTVHIDGSQEGLFLPQVGNSVLDETEAHYSGNKFFSCKIVSGLNLNILLSGFFWVVSLVGAFLEGHWHALNYTGLFAVLFGMPPVALKAFRTIRRYHFDANCMMVTAALGALILQEYDEAASVAFLFTISGYLEDRATRKARNALDSIVSLRPDYANLLSTSTGEVQIIPANNLKIGSTVIVKTGDKIPSDGVVVEGSSFVDESSLTGESVPIQKERNDSVFGGTINIGDTRLLVKTTSTTESSAVSRLIRLVEESASNRSPTEKIVDAFAKSYTPAVLFAAVLMCTIPWFWGGSAGRQWTLNGLILIIIACPCALTISTPVTYAAGLAAAAKKGIVIKGGASLEALGSVKTVIFDKTGTLTEGNFEIIHLNTVGNLMNRKEVLECLASMEASSSHPLAAAILRAANIEGIEMKKTTKVYRHSTLKGEGITAFIDDRQAYVGNTRLFKRLGMYQELGELHKKNAHDWNEEGGTVGFIGIDGLGIVGMYSVADTVRSEAREVVSTLIEDGMNVLMLTGDNDGAARFVAKKVGLTESCVQSQFLPDDKLHYVASLLGFSRRKSYCCSRKELLLMCGDGVNDAPALAVADIGVAMGEGSAVALEMSDVTLMDSNLTKLLFSIKIGMKVTTTVQENIALSVVAKVIVIILTFVGKMNLLGAIISDVGVMLFVSINGMKLLPNHGRWRLLCRRRRKYREIDQNCRTVDNII